MLSEIV